MDIESKYTMPEGRFGPKEENETPGEIFGRVRFYRVMGISSNTNNFGLRGVIMTRRNGETWEVGMNYLRLEGIKIGTILTIPQTHPNGQPDFSGLGEIPRRLPDCPMDIVAEVWKDATADDRLDVQRWKCKNKKA